jgi:hypothetical protein
MATNRWPIPLHVDSGTNLDTYYPSGTASGVGIPCDGARSVTLMTHRESETGTCTFQAFFEVFMEAAGTTGGSWYPLLDLNNATQVAGVVYADGVTDGTTPFHRFVTLRDVGRLTTAADNAVAINTVHMVYTLWIPNRIRIRFRHGGTTVSNTWSAQILVNR